MDTQPYPFRNIRTQGVGSVVSEANKRNLAELYKELNRIKFQSAAEKRIVEERLEDALDCIDRIYDFVGSPENILGSQATKHGEIAEHVDVEFHNAWNAIRGKAHNATFENVGRTAPEDYLVGGVAVQSKYINGSNNSLSRVLEHLEKYADIHFGRDGSYYVIPKDQYKQIDAAISGKATGLSDKSVRAIKEKVSRIETETGRKFSEVVHPGSVDYAEVQQGTIHRTLHQEERKLRGDAQDQKEKIEEKSKDKRQAAQEKAAPSWGKAAKAAGASAAISGGLQFAFGILRKCKQGKQIQDFTNDDWKELGIDTAKAAAEGGISGLAIYGLTNYAKVSSPAAAAGVSLVFGLVELTHEYGCNHITKEEYLDGCLTIGINSVVCAVGAALGERLIPVPVLGGIIGSAIAGNICNALMGQGLENAVLCASEYVYGSTVSMLQAAGEIAGNHQTSGNNIRKIQEISEEIQNRSNEFHSEMRGLL